MKSKNENEIDFKLKKFYLNENEKFKLNELKEKIQLSLKSLVYLSYF